MTDPVEILERTAERGEPRGIDAIWKRAEHRTRARRRRLQTVVGVAAALVVAGSLAVVRSVGDGAEDVVVAGGGDDTGDVVAMLPLDGDRFELQWAAPLETWEPSPDGLGNLVIHQSLDQQGNVDAAVVIGATTAPPTEQTTLLDVFPLAEGTAEGERGSYPVGDSESTNGLIVTETTIEDVRVRVATRNLDVATTVEILEHVTIDDGRVRATFLPPGLDPEPDYQGLDISRLGIQPSSTARAFLLDRQTGDDLEVISHVDDSFLSASLRVWWSDGMLDRELPAETIRTNIGGSGSASWHDDGVALLVVGYGDPPSHEQIAAIQSSGQAITAEHWARLHADHPPPADLYQEATTSTALTDDRNTPGTLLEQTPVATNDSAENLPTPDGSCGIEALGGVRTDARNWTENSEEATLTIVPTVDCVLDAVDLVISSGQSSPRPISAAQDATNRPITVRANDGITIRVTNSGGVECEPERYPGWGEGWLQLRLGDNQAESRQRYPTNPACEYSYTIDIIDQAERPAYPPCDADTGFVNTGARDYAGTRNTTFSNRGQQACRVDSVDVLGATVGGETIPFTDYGAGNVSGIADNVLPAVLGPGRGIVVLLVSHPTCLPQTTEITSTAIRVAEQVVDIPTVAADACKGSYTVDLIEDVE